MLVGSWTAPLLVNALGFVWPAYRSFKALKDPTQEAAQAMWLTYWIVFALFSAVSFVPDTLLSWVPLYWDAKVLFVLWLQAPYTQGATILYKSRVQPLLAKHEGAIDEKVNRAKSRVLNLRFEDVQPIIAWFAARATELSMSKAADGFRKRDAAEYIEMAAQLFPKAASPPPVEPVEPVESAEDVTELHPAEEEEAETRPVQETDAADMPAEAELPAAPDPLKKEN